MKFSNGNWLMREGITATHAVDIGDYNVFQDKLTIFTTGSMGFPGMKRRMLGGTMLTLEVTSPANNIIGVRLTHFKGATKRGPEYALGSGPFDVVIEDSTDTITYRSGNLSASFVKSNDGLQLEFRGSGKLLTRSGARSMSYFQDLSTKKNYISQQLDISVGECLYGLGERFGPFVKNGQSIDMWMADGGTGTEQAYKNVPFYLSNRGYGVFVNSPSDISYEIASEKVERACFSVEDETMQYFIIYGETPKDILERYTLLTGRPALPPAWSFGLWLSTSFTTDYDEETATTFIQGMKDRDIPLHVFHFDCFWMKGNHWTDFEWDADMFPNPREMLIRYKKRGLHICVWINSYIAQASALFDEAIEKGYLIKKTDGSVWQTDLWQSGMGIVDFTNPDACVWYQSKLDELMEMGVDCFKTDFGERIPVRDIAYYDGSDPLKMHNYYTHLYNKVVFEAVERRRGKGDAVVFARSGTAGTQMYPVHWGGDNSGNYPSMAETLRAGLSLAVSGYGFWSHDIGGFEATAPADIYKRWCVFGLLSSHSRLHGSNSYRVPWNFDEESVDVLRFFVKLKCRLMPYLYAKSIEAHEEGTPVLRPMVFEFINDSAVAWLDQQYMLGDSLLVAPVFHEEGIVTFYVPKGNWTDYLNGKVYIGERYYTEQYDYLSLPLLVRPNTILLIGSNETRPDYNYVNGLTARIYEPDENVVILAKIPSIDGSIISEITAVKKNGNITVSSSKPMQHLIIEYADNSYIMNGTSFVIPA